MSVNGCIIPGTPIAVDFWHTRELSADSFIFFLTHLHGDHIVGLTSTWRHPIYCSELTAELLNTLYGVDRRLLHPLEMGKAHLVPVATQDNGDSSYITVSVIDANHCPGAVMFLFEGVFGKILHTGDFRYTSDLIKKSILSDHRDSIDVVYLDNTFCHPQCIFPTQHEARTTILKIIQQHNDCNVVLGMRNLGKEDLLAWLGLSLKEWISVTGKMYERIQTFGLPNVFKICDKSLRIRVEPFRLVSKKMLRQWNEEKRTIAILPTAIFTGIGGTPFANQHNIFVVPYSDHSSYSELTEFVSKIRPCSVVPIVSSATRGPFGVDLSSRADMSCFETYCRHAGGTQIRKALRIPSKLPHVIVSNVCMKQRRNKRKRQIVHKKIIKGVEYDSDDGVNVLGSSDLQVSVEQKTKSRYSDDKSLKPSEHDNCLKEVDFVINVASDVSTDVFLSREEVCGYNQTSCLHIDRSVSDYAPCGKCTSSLLSTKHGNSKSTHLDDSNESKSNCATSGKSMSTLSSTKPDFAVIKQKTYLSDTRFQIEQSMVKYSIKDETFDCYSHDTSSLKGSCGESVQNMADRFNILEKYSVKSMPREQCTKKVVAALNKWLSDV